jgi:hypothetical protein
VRIEILMVMTVKSTDLWDVLIYSLVEIRVKEGAVWASSKQGKLSIEESCMDVG